MVRIEHEDQVLVLEVVRQSEGRIGIAFFGVILPQGIAVRRKRLIVPRRQRTNALAACFAVVHTGHACRFAGIEHGRADRCRTAVDTAGVEEAVRRRRCSLHHAAGVVHKVTKAVWHLLVVAVFDDHIACNDRSAVGHNNHSGRGRCFRRDVERRGKRIGRFGVRLIHYPLACGR